jgi:hypothetical protein
MSFPLIIGCIDFAEVTHIRAMATRRWMKNPQMTE